LENARAGGRRAMAFRFPLRWGNLISRAFSNTPQVTRLKSVLDKAILLAAQINGLTPTEREAKEIVNDREYATHYVARELVRHPNLLVSGDKKNLTLAKNDDSAKSFLCHDEITSEEEDSKNVGTAIAFESAEEEQHARSQASGDGERLKLFQSSVSLSGMGLLNRIVSSTEKINGVWVNAKFGVPLDTFIDTADSYLSELYLRVLSLMGSEVFKKLSKEEAKQLKKKI